MTGRDLQLGLTDAVNTGDRRVALVALRDHLARTITAAEPGQVAALARQLTLVLEALDAMTAGTETTALDELTARRAARRAGGSGT